MNQALKNNISFLERPGNHLLLRNVLRGIERECLRIDEAGFISQTPHPEALGSALTNPFITTDFSESLIEFVTPTFNTPANLMQFLTDLHIFTLKNIGNEYLWPISIPCLKRDQEIPIANYGSSNIGKMKTLYRKGLHHRYGSPMQIISGIHYNFSMPEEFWPLYKDYFKSKKNIQDFKSERYLSLIRNVHKYGWLLLYLFGASPNICPNFITSKKQLEGLTLSEDKTTLYMEHATSLRMSHLGYQNKANTEVSVCHRTLESYIEDLSKAIHTKDPEWEKLGLFKDNERIQISDSILQIENEYYSSIRPKRRIKSGERPTTALEDRGIEYVELRSLDINPNAPAGIDESQVKFLDTFLTWCLLKNSTCCNHETETHQKFNHNQVVANGRKENLTLFKSNSEVSLKSWASEIFDELRPIAKLYDKSLKAGYEETLNNFKTLIDDPTKLYSDQILKESLETNLHQFAFSKSKQYKEILASMSLSKDRETLFTHTAQDSLRKTSDIENSDNIPFDEYLKQYFLQV